MGKANKFVIASLFLIPISGVFSTDVWEMQYNCLLVLSLIGSVIGISYLKPKPLVCAIIALCTLQGTLVVLQALGLDPLFNGIKDSTQDLPFGFSGSPNQSGLFFAVTLPIVVAYCPWLLPLQLFALFMAKTTSAVIGASVAILFLTVTKRQYLTIICVPLLVLLFLIKFETISTEVYKERYNLWKHSVQAVTRGNIQLLYKGKLYHKTCNPLFGFGHGSFSKLSPYNQSLWINKNVQHRYYKCHNDYIQVFFEYGWLGITALFMFLCTMFYRFAKAKKTKILMVVTACLIAHLVSALGIFTIHTATSGMLLLTMSGIYLGLTRGNKNGK